MVKQTGKPNVRAMWYCVNFAKQQASLSAKHGDVEMALYWNKRAQAHELTAQLAEMLKQVA